MRAASVKPAASGLAFKEKEPYPIFCNLSTYIDLEGERARELKEEGI
jgi:hypothetical protein